jgi:hypothetical protein
MQTDKNGLYTDEYGVSEIRLVNADSVKEVSGKIDGLAAEFTDMNIYYSFIPDKSVYSGKKLPGFNIEQVKENLTTQAQFIDICDILSAESFYRTDLHWNQARLQPVVQALSEAMGFTPDTDSYKEVNAGYFEGVYSGQIALPVGGDEMIYHENPNLEALYLNSAATGFEPGPVYSTDKFAGVNSLDPYDIFLNGAQPLVIINNNSPAANGELYLFRDSFSSSLAPLLAGSYKKTVLIDLRYTDMPTLRRLIEFVPGSDVLFLYSSQILNRADALLL